VSRRVIINALDVARRCRYNVPLRVREVANKHRSARGSFGGAEHEFVCDCLCLFAREAKLLVGGRPPTRYSSTDDRQGVVRMFTRRQCNARYTYNEGGTTRVMACNDIKDAILEVSVE